MHELCPASPGIATARVIETSRPLAEPPGGYQGSHRGDTWREYGGRAAPLCGELAAPPSRSTYTIRYSARAFDPRVPVGTRRRLVRRRAGRSPWRRRGRGRERERA